MLSSRLVLRKGVVSASRRKSSRWSLDVSRSLSAVLPPSRLEDEEQSNELLSSAPPVYVQNYNARLGQLTSRSTPFHNWSSASASSNLPSARRLYSTFSSSHDHLTSNLASNSSLTNLNRLQSYHHQSPLSVNRYLTPQLSWKRYLYTSTVKVLSELHQQHPLQFERHLQQRSQFSADAKKTESSTSSKPTGDGTSDSNVTTNNSSSSKEKKPMAQQVQEAITSAAKSIVTFLLKLPGWTFFYLTHPTELRSALNGLWDAVKHEANHYWMGTKLLYADVQTAGTLLNRTLHGTSLTRRERKQLLRTVSDLFRLVPFSMFILIPFMEFALPFALRLFPNMLPSTFQDSLKAEEGMKRELQSRIAMAQFFQETLQGMAKEQKKIATKRRENADESEKEETALKQEQSAGAMLEFLNSARSGEPLPAEVIIQFAAHFHDDLTLDNMPRMQLINMCRYMNIPPYGSDNFLRFQLRHSIRSLVEDDQRILWEGIESLTKMELREACQERGMRSTGLSKDAYKSALQQWLDLSVNKHIPISLLIMSRSFFLREEMTTRGSTDEDGSKAVAGLADAISGLDQDIVNEVVLEVATSEEKMSSPEIRKIKLEVLEAQNERIMEEKMEREAATKKKEQKEKEKEEKEKEKEEQEEAMAAAEAIQSSSPDISPGSTAAAEAVAKDVAEDVAEDVVEEEEEYLSTQEMDALSQLVNPDPVTNEREELKRIKAAMANAESEEERQELELMKASMVSERTQRVSVPWGDGEAVYTDTAMDRVTQNIEIEPSPDAATPEEVEKAAEALIGKMDEESAAEADSASKMDYEVAEEEDSAAEEDHESGDQYLDTAIERLKQRVSGMVEKIESQLDTVNEKIGDKLHFLDKDRDGILTLEEMADALQRVLKRDLSRDEAMAIAALMDENKDGLFTVEEFKNWIETNRIVQLVKDGEDGDLDRLLTKHSKSQKEEKESS